jgi:hypothetical protein
VTLNATTGIYSGHSNAVDLYNSVSGNWSTAQLSVARDFLKVTSVGNVAIFAEGSNFIGNPSVALCAEGLQTFC